MRKLEYFVYQSSSLEKRNNVPGFAFDKLDFFPALRKFEVEKCFQIIQGENSL